MIQYQRDRGAQGKVPVLRNLRAEQGDRQLRARSERPGGRVSWDRKGQALNPAWGKVGRASWRNGCLRQTQKVCRLLVQQRLQEGHFREWGWHAGRIIRVRIWCAQGYAQSRNVCPVGYQLEQ